MKTTLNLKISTRVATFGKDSQAFNMSFVTTVQANDTISNSDQTAFNEMIQTKKDEGWILIYDSIITNELNINSSMIWT